MKFKSTLVAASILLLCALFPALGSKQMEPVVHDSGRPLDGLSAKIDAQAALLNQQCKKVDELIANAKKSPILGAMSVTAEGEIAFAYELLANATVKIKEADAHYSIKFDKPFEDENFAVATSHGGAATPPVTLTVAVRGNEHLQINTHIGPTPARVDFDIILVRGR